MVVDATGVPEVGAQIALAALRAGKHVGLLNVECDVTIGFLLARIAAQNAAGSTPCAAATSRPRRVRLVEFARDLAFEVVARARARTTR